MVVVGSAVVVVLSSVDFSSSLVVVGSAVDMCFPILVVSSAIIVVGSTVVFIPSLVLR